MSQTTIIEDNPLTHHGLKRFRERLGLPARAAKRLVRRAFTEGASLEEMPAWARFCLAQKDLKAHRDGRPKTFRLYRDFLFIFDASSGALITCYPMELE